ncbi:hypothetical protein [Microbacterium sp. No. 7]|uniref:hypothetical protein n=1 Tax=Microbacterium sp. No. 7 TaxID=1714373 RepID=UPI0006CFD458|nr:hypothetical protein [Microbacterium sp. No. 7]ALJ20368.1 hypothetical protein AOA12_10785 [Microbacterium sp. No. 7]
MPTPNLTPNVVIENPKARRIARTTLDIVGVALGTLLVVDAATDAFDAVAFTTPFLAGWTYLRLAFGLAIDNPNTPRTESDPYRP